MALHTYTCKHAVLLDLGIHRKFFPGSCQEEEDEEKEKEEEEEEEVEEEQAEAEAEAEERTGTTLI